MDDLAQRFLACPAWRWMPGMLAGDGERVLEVLPTEVPLMMTASAEHRVTTTPAHLMDPPSLDDPATLGCIRQLVSEAHGGAKVYTAWALWVDGVGVFDGDSEAEALLLALEAAP